jgi:hypothetical protein
MFAGYIFSGFLVAVMTYLVARSGNRVQDAIRKDADVRIAEARAEGATANERAARLEKDNLTLKGQVAGLETAASDAKAAQQRVESDLEKQKEVTARAEKDVAGLKKAAAEQQERAANAERALLELQEKLRYRHLSDSQISELSELLAKLPPARIRVFWAMEAPDGESYGKEFVALFKKIGREPAPEDSGKAIFNGSFSGIRIAIHDEKDAATEAAGVLQIALRKIGIEAPGSTGLSVPTGSVELEIGPKE